MPEMDGFKLTRIIRDNAIYADIPLIYLTGNSSRDYIANAMAVGCSDFIIKPVNHDDLLATVGKHLYIST